jgi:hypothetical protein
MKALLFLLLLPASSLFALINTVKNENIVFKTELKDTILPYLDVRQIDSLYNATYHEDTISFQKGLVLGQNITANRCEWDSSYTISVSLAPNYKIIHTKGDTLVLDTTQYKYFQLGNVVWKISVLNRDLKLSYTVDTILLNKDKLLKP